MRVFENGVLGIFGAEEGSGERGLEETVHNSNEHRDHMLFIRAMRSTRMRWVGHVAR